MSQQHTDSVHTSPIVTGTIEWPTIKNARVTLFYLMDHLQQGLPPYFVAHWYHLTSEEMDEVMQFLKAHEAAIEQSYAAAMPVPLHSAAIGKPGIATCSPVM